MLNRDFYTSIIKNYYGNSLIKVLVGMRGSGKTTIFFQLMEDLKNDDMADESHIIYINYEYLENEKLKYSDKLLSYIKKKIVDENRYYIFLDEIHNIPNFEQVLYDVFNKYINVELFVSCSNTRCLRKNLNSSLSYCYKIFYLTPFSYTETCNFLKTDPKNKNMLLNYLKYGGLPARLQCKKSSEVKKYLYTLLDSIYLKDIVIHLGVSDISNIITILKYVIKYIGTAFSLEQIKEDLIKNNEEITDEKLYTDFECLQNALIIEGANTYNVQTDTICYGVPRYYLSDLGIAFIYGLDIPNNMDALIKNMLWIELKRRGYDVYTGLNCGKHFDFVAIRNGKYMYFQAVYELFDGNTINKEIEKMGNFDFNGQRYLISLDRDNFSRKGVIHKNLIDFILEEDSDKPNKDELSTWVAVE